MPVQTVEDVAPNGVINLSDFPGGKLDDSLDTIFSADSSNVVIAPAQQTPTQQTPVAQATPQTTPQADQPKFFLKGEKSVYETPEAATAGINQKDALIETLRQRYALTTGIDPITGKPVAQGPIQPEVIDYSSRPDAYLDDLYNAAKKGGPEAYRDVQQKFIMDTVKPLAPILTKAARDQASDTLVKDNPAAKDFVGSPAFQAALEANPELKQAVGISENDYRFHSRLPGLYRIAFLTSQGMQLPQILKAQADQAKSTPQTTTSAAAPAAATARTPVRTTVQQTTPGVGTPTTPPSFNSIEGIRAIIRDSEARGVNLNW